MRLLDPVTFGPRTAPNRVMFGPHVTNLGDDDRRLTERHVAYYAATRRRRVRHDRGRGCERARVGLAVRASAARRTVPRRLGVDRRRLPPARRTRHRRRSTTPVGRDRRRTTNARCGRRRACPRSTPARCRSGWRRATSTPSSTGSRTPPGWPPRPAATVSRSTPDSTASCASSCSGLTNQRDDEWGHDRTAVRATGDRGGPRRERPRPDRRAAAVVRRARAVGRHHARAGAGHRRRPRRIAASTTSSSCAARSTRPRRPDPTSTSRPASTSSCVGRSGPDGRVDVPVVLQGSVVDVGQAEWALGDDDERGRVRRGRDDARPDRRPGPGRRSSGADAADEIRPCTRCNQTCQVRDVRNPIVTCIGEPTSGRETEDPDWYAPATTPRSVVVIGGGPAGMETARVAAGEGTRSSSSSGRRGSVASPPSPARTLRSSSGSNARSGDAA